MTICIAAVCDYNTGEPKIVFCSDRLVTDSNGLTFEQAIPKVVELLPHCLIMNAGDGCNGDAIINEVATDLNNNFTAQEQMNMGIEQIAELIKDKYDLYKQRAIEQKFLKPRGFDLKTFYEKIKEIPDWLALMIDTQISTYNFDVAYIVLGIDVNHEKKTASPVLFTIQDGELQYMTQTGFTMVGIGCYQSLPEITKEPYSVNISLSDSIVRTFWAKKISERMVSVGKETTDLGILYPVYDTENKKVIVRNVLLSDYIKKRLSDAFETQKQAMKQISDTVSQETGKELSGNKNVGNISS